jgi:hypothetical protein
VGRLGHIIYHRWQCTIQVNPGEAAESRGSLVIVLITLYSLLIVICNHACMLVAQNLMENKPADMTLLQYIKRVRDPTTLAVLLEDGGACIGIVMAIVGIGLSQATANPIFDRCATLSSEDPAFLCMCAYAHVDRRKCTNGLTSLIFFPLCSYRLPMPLKALRACASRACWRAWAWHWPDSTSGTF